MMLAYFSQYSLAEIAGVGGFLLYVFNYSMLSLRRISGDCIGYYVLNVCAASLVLIGLTASFNLASAMIQVFWVAMSTIGIVLRLYRARRLHYTELTRTDFDSEVTIPAQPDAPFQSAPHWADASRESGSPDRVYV